MNSELNIDFTLLPENVPAICVPYVFDNILEQRMMGIFNALSIGEVCRIDEVPYTATDGKKVKRVFVHLKWKIDPTANKIRTKLLCGKKVKVLYDDPWFWEISASRAKETPKRDAPVQSRKPRIELDDDVGSKPRKQQQQQQQEQYQRPKHRDYRPKLPMAPTLLPMAPLMPMSLLPPAATLQVEQFVPTTPPTPPQDHEDEHEDEDEDEDEDEEEFPALPTKYGKNYGDIDQPEEVPTGIDYNVSHLLPPEKKKRVTKKATKEPKEPVKTDTDV